MEIKELNTEVLDDAVGRIEDIAELRQMLDTILAYQKEQWPLAIKRILADAKTNKCTQEQIGEYCGVSRQAVNKWTRGTKPDRAKLIKLAIIAGYNKDETDYFLDKYGRCHQLYTKNLEDCVCIYVINKAENEKKNGVAMSIKERIELYDALLERFKDSIKEELVTNERTINTTIVDERLSRVNKEDELAAFIDENKAQFYKQYRRLYAKIKAYDDGLIYGDYGILSGEEDNNCTEQIKGYARKVKSKKWIPDRDGLIKFCLYMNYTHEQVDELLDCAQMGKLYPGNVEEAMIIYALDNAELINLIGDEAVDMQEEYDPYYLMNYINGIKEKINVPEIDECIEEFFSENGKDEEREIEI